MPTHRQRELDAVVARIQLQYGSHAADLLPDGRGGDPMMITYPDLSR